MIFTITFYWQTMSINDERVILSLSIHYVYLNLNVITSHAVSTATEWSAQNKDIRFYFQLLHIPVYFQCHGSLITTSFLNLTCCMCLTTDTHPVAVASQSCCYGCSARSLERFVCSFFLVVNNLRFSCGLWCVITAAPHLPTAVGDHQCQMTNQISCCTLPYFPSTEAVMIMILIGLWSTANHVSWMSDDVVMSPSSERRYIRYMIVGTAAYTRQCRILFDPSVRCLTPPVTCATQWVIVECIW